jgi:crotonobetainyl-CoA:carnitine CoA-transferase CaiB-like acyl-CoA transferase
MQLPLEGVRVVDTTRWAFGPFVSACLADMGAEVIKVEDPISGDGSRWVHKSRDVPVETERNPVFELLNRGKKGVAIDLNKERGKEILYRMVKTADIFLTAQLPKSALKLGIDYERLREINPRLIYAHCGAWGDKGPAREAPAFDGSAFARSGLMHIIGEKGNPPPNCPHGMGDLVGSMTMAYGIMLALRYRELTGKGQKVEVSLFGTMITVMEAMSQEISLHANVDYPQYSRTSPTNALSNTYQTKDGRWLFLNMHQTDPYWHKFCQAAGIGQWENDPRFKDHFTRCDNVNDLRLILEETFSQRDLSDWVKCLEGTGFPWAPVQTIQEVWDDPQVLANDYIVSYEHPTLGRQRTVGFPVKLSDLSLQINRNVPELGQNTEEILLQLGYSWEEMQGLKQEQVIM